MFSSVTHDQDPSVFWKFILTSVHVLLSHAVGIAKLIVVIPSPAADAAGVGRYAAERTTAIASMTPVILRIFLIYDTSI